MWCKQCGQDVPGVASPESRDLTCARCGRVLSNRASGDTASAQAPQDSLQSAEAEAEPDPNAPVSSDPPLLYDSWELDEQLRHLERVLGRGKKGDDGGQSVPSRETFRLDLPHGGPAGRHRPVKPKLPARRATASGASEGVLPLLSWTSLSLGLMAFACGGVLLGWSVLSGRQDLWSIGMPIVLGGQVGLLVGLVLQLDRLWSDTRSTVEKLDHVDDQLRDLKTTTTMLGSGHESGGRAFYSHMVEGAGPQLLLNDLKSQLDLLALKISQDQ